MLKNYTVLNIKKIFFVIMFQIAFLLLISFLVFFMFGYKFVLSGVYGGITSIFSSLLFLTVLFFNYKNFVPKIIVRKFYLAGLLKFTLLILIFSVVFKFGIYSPLCFFIFLFLIQTSFWLLCSLFIFYGDMDSYERK